jgi:hypothetical protein
VTTKVAPVTKPQPKKQAPEPPASSQTFDSVG